MKADEVGLMGNGNGGSPGGKGLISSIHFMFVVHNLSTLVTLTKDSTMIDFVDREKVCRCHVVDANHVDTNLIDVEAQASPS
jgi:hypothetical protein